MLEDITVVFIVVITVLFVCKRIYLRISKKNEECGCVSKEDCIVQKRF